MNKIQLYRKHRTLTTILLLGLFFVTGCAARQENADAYRREKGADARKESTYTREELGNIAKIEIYSAKDDTLLKTITDEETIYQYNQCGVFTDLDGDDAPDAEAYRFVSYKYAAARFGNQEPEKTITVTIYESGNIAKITIAEDVIKSFSLPQEFLTFYERISDEDLAFYHSLIE